MHNYSLFNFLSFYAHIEISSGSLNGIKSKWHTNELNLVKDILSRA